MGVKELTEGENENEAECNVYCPLHYGSFWPVTPRSDQKGNSPHNLDSGACRA